MATVFVLMYTDWADDNCEELLGDMFVGVYANEARARKEIEDRLVGFEGEAPGSVTWVQDEDGSLRGDVTLPGAPNDVYEGAAWIGKEEVIE